MKNVVYKFLDEYIGDELIVVDSVTLYWCNLEPKNHVGLGREVISFFHVPGDDYIRLIEICPSLVNKIMGYFSIKERKTKIYIEKWLSEKFGLERESDLLNMIPKERIK
jgi:hypothetical protein